MKAWFLRRKSNLCFLCLLSLPKACSPWRVAAKAFGVAFCKTLCGSPASTLQPFNALTLQPRNASPAPRVSSSRTATARSYRALASSRELPTAVRPVLPNSPRALIM
jgi:hypothetical protein